MPSKLGREFIDRWFTPDLINRNPDVLNSRFLTGIGQRLEKIDRQYIQPANYHNRISLLNLGDLSDMNRTAFLDLWRYTCRRFNLASLRVDVGTDVIPTPYDFLITTPVARSADHVQEAKDIRDQYEINGTIGHYWREFNPYSAPTNLRIGSKFFYVDQHYITGFGAITDLKINPQYHGLSTHMAADTWRWINPIFCDYNMVKPPQRYAYFQKHDYTRHLTSVKIIGGWLDPKPLGKK